MSTLAAEEDVGVAAVDAVAEFDSQVGDEGVELSNGFLRIGGLALELELYEVSGAGHRVEGDRPSDADQHLNRLDGVISAMAARQIKRADERMAAGRRPSPGEFDLVRGLIGLGVYFLRRDPTGPYLREVLGYLVRLTAPIRAADSAGTRAPGWWTGHLPEGRPATRFADGHSDQGMATVSALSMVSSPFIKVRVLSGAEGT
ncbi:hypothetical protein [Sinosporangium album]|uniref:hypothetical protein n=1 Tax=Sinosporangium album TaxID=504805 RepID=UPI00115FF8E2|nr:hypothetical protein [Sinosporangium album]